MISTVCLADSNTAKYIEAQNKLAEGIYISTGIQQNLNNYTKYLEEQVDREYRPLLGWTFSTIDVIIKGRIEYKVRFP